MIDFYVEKQRLQALELSIKTSTDALGAEKIAETLVALREKQQSDGYWNDIASAQKDSREIAVLEKKMNKLKEVASEAADIAGLMELCEEADDAETASEIPEMLSVAEKKAEELFLETLLTGEYDKNNAVITVHAGAGGTEAQDWAEMLYRMYTRYAEREGYKVTVLDLQQGDEAGIKGVTFKIDGENAYGFLKAEKGVHRLVRISPFDSNKRRHTSFASLEVMPEIPDDGEIVIEPEDLRIDTCRSSGAGGQHVNKTESAIRITHIPTGIVTWCQNERSQIQNKETAMKMLLSKLAELKEREQAAAAAEIQGELKKIEWGSQIRSYVFCPYTMVKDHRTGYENTNVGQVMDGDIDGFIREYLVKSGAKKA